MRRAILKVLKFPKQKRESVKLTKSVVDNLQYNPADKAHTVLRDSEIPGFEVRAFANRKTWCLRYRSPVTGKQRVLKIGSCAEVTAHQARQVATKARGLILAGEDPQDVRDKARGARGAARVGDICRRWIDEYAKENRKTWKEDQFRLFPKDKKSAVYKVHKLPVTDRQAISDVLRVVHKEMADTPTQANRLVQTVNAVLNYATKNRWVEGLRNVAEDVDRYQEKPREDYLRPAEFKTFLAAVDKLGGKDDHWRRDGTHWQTLIRFLLFTGCRYGEATGLLKTDVFRDAGIFIFRETKNGSDHELPLTPTLLGLIDSAPEWDGETVWEPKNPRKTFKEIEKAGFVAASITPHALRHTLRTTMLVELQIPLDVVGAVTNHRYDYGAGSRYVHVSSEAVSDAIERYAAWIQSR